MQRIHTVLAALCAMAPALGATPAAAQRHYVGTLGNVGSFDITIFGLPPLYDGTPAHSYYAVSPNVSCVMNGFTCAGVYLMPEFSPQQDLIALDSQELPGQYAGQLFPASTVRGLGTFKGDKGAVVTISLGGAPEPASWALLILGFGAAGDALRRRRTVTRRTQDGLFA